MRTQYQSRNRIRKDVLLLALILTCLLLAALAQGVQAAVLNGSRPPQIITRNFDDRVAAGQEFGDALAMGDFNGDSFEDLAVGIPYKTVGNEEHAGQVVVFHGSPQGTNAEPGVANRIFDQSEAGVAFHDNWFGHAVTSGDFDGDGYDDLAVGAPGSDNESDYNVGKITIIYGGPAGLGTGRAAIEFTQYGFGVGGDEWEDKFGWTLASGDIDGDGYEDVVCGTPYEDIGTDNNVGALEVLYGSSGGIQGTGNQIIEWGMVDSDDVEMIFGWSLAVGDFDGDGYDDIAAGSPGEQDNNERGEVLVVFGGSGGASASSATAEIFDIGVFLGLTGDDNDHFGWSLASADYDGDGFDDLAIGAPGRDVSDGVSEKNNAGMVFVSFGGSMGFMEDLHSTALRPQFFNQSQAFSGSIEEGDGFGRCLTSGDLNGDGFGDLVISSPDEDIGSTPDAGVLGVLYGSPLELAGGTPSEAGWQETLLVGNSHKYDEFGYSLVCGDANGDGTDDLAVGVPYKDPELKDNAGEVCVIYGSNALGDVLSTVAHPLALPAVDASSVEWVDFSGDGLLDFLLTGWTGTEAISRLYQNDGAGSFVEVPLNLEGVIDGSSAWEDYDNDGDLDLLLTGYTTPFGDAKPVSRLYRNDGDQGFTSQDHLALPRVGDSAVVWLDYDDDGKMDILLTGRANGAPIAVIYRNDFYFDYSDELVSRFTDAGLGLEGVCHGAASWFEGWLVVTGLSASGPSSRLYAFADGELILNKSLSPGVYRGTATFTPPLEPASGGMWNLVLTGATHAPGWPVSRVLQPSTLEGYKFPPLGVYRSAADWGDFDNDGDIDLLFTGKKYDGSREAFVNVNSFDEDARFHNRPLDLPAVDNGDIAWADWDNDGLFEVLISGSTDSGRSTGLYELTGVLLANTVPRAPGGLVCSLSDGNATLEWMPASDAETPQSGLSYALRVGSTPGGCEILAPAAHSVTGKRKLVKPGNAGFNTSKTIAIPPGVETIYWSVQAVDGGCAGSPFSAEQTVSLNAADPEGPVMPTVRALHQNSPNPFNPSTTIYFDLVSPERVDLVVYDAGGRLVKSLLSGESLPVGRHEAIWSGRDSHGRIAAAGIYFYVLTSENFRETRRMALVK